MSLPPDRPPPASTPRELLPREDWSKRECLPSCRAGPGCSRSRRRSWRIAVPPLGALRETFRSPRYVCSMWSETAIAAIRPLAGRPETTHSLRTIVGDRQVRTAFGPDLPPWLGLFTGLGRFGRPGSPPGFRRGSRRTTSPSAPSHSGRMPSRCPATPRRAAGRRAARPPVCDRVPSGSRRARRGSSGSRARA